jgi:hypothetical protein
MPEKKKINTEILDKAIIFATEAHKDVVLRISE